MMAMMNNPMRGNFVPPSPMKVMQNNPMFRVLQAARNGQNPMPIMYDIAKQNPVFSQPLSMIDGKNVESQKQTAFNMAKEYRIDLSQFAALFGISLPK